MKTKFHRRAQKGQMIMEFCIMLVVAVLLVYGLLALFDVLSKNGDRMVNMVGHTVP